MASPLQNFREQYPQYGDLDDEALGSRLHQKFYSDIDYGEFRQKVGLPGTQVTKTPTAVDRVNGLLAEKARAPKSLLNADAEEQPSLPEPEAKKAEDKGFFENMRDMFFAGWKDYRAARDNASAFGSIKDMGEARDVALGRKGGTPGGGFAGLGGSIAKQARAIKAVDGDRESQRAIVEEMDQHRETARRALQESIDSRKRHLAERAGIHPSEVTQRMIAEESFTGAAKAFVEDPLTIMTELTAQSLPNMADAVVLAAVGSAMGPKGMMVGMGLGSGMAEYRASFSEALEKEGVDLGDARSMLSAAEDEALMARVSEKSLTRAAIIGSLDAASAGLAGKALTPFVKNVVARQISNQAVQGVGQAVLGGTGEALAQLATEGKVRWGEVAAEAAGEGLTSGIEVGLATVSGLSPKAAMAEVERVEADVRETLGQVLEARAPENLASEPKEEDFSESEWKKIQERYGFEEDVGGFVRLIEQGTSAARLREKKAYMDRLDPNAWKTFSREKLKQWRSDPDISDEDIRGFLKTDEVLLENFVEEVANVELWSIYENEYRSAVSEEFQNAWDAWDSARAEADVSVPRGTSGQLLEARGPKEIDSPAATYQSIEFEPLGTDTGLVGGMEALTEEQRDVLHSIVLYKGTANWMDQGYATEILSRPAAGSPEAFNWRTVLKEPDPSFAELPWGENINLGPARAMDPEATPQRVREVMESLAAAPYRPDGQEVFRGVSVNAEGLAGLKKGAVVDLPSVQSFSFDEGLAEQFAERSPEEGDTPVLFKLKPSKGTDLVAMNPNEAEFVTSGQVRVESVKRRPNRIPSGPEVVAVVLAHVAPERTGFKLEARIGDLDRIRNELGEDAEAAAVATVQEALEQSGIDATIENQNVVVRGDDRVRVESAVDFANAVLSTQEINTPMGRYEGLSISGPNRPHSAKGRILDSRTPTLNMEEGTNYVPMIGLEGRLPINANNEFVLGNGRTVRIPKEPVRRHHIMGRLEREFGLKIYQGRVKGPKTRLGFFRTGQGEVRVRHANDIETAAHEVAHWLDEKNPWMQKLYKGFEGELKSVSYDDQSTVEGFAEWFRLFMTQDPEAQRTAPAFYDAFAKELARRPSLQETVFDLQEMMHAWAMQGVRARFAGKVGDTDLSAVDKIRTLLPKEGSLQKGVDGLKAIKMAELDVTDGQTHEAYNRLRLAVGGASSTMEAAYYYGTPGWRKDGQGLELSGESLKDIFGGLWGDEDMAIYMLARRAQELEQLGKRSGFRPDEIAYGLDLARVRPEFADVFNRYQAFNRRILDFAEQSGILSPEARAAMEEMHKNYVPFHRVMESVSDGKGLDKISGGTTSNPFRRIKGSSRNVKPVWENVINNLGVVLRASLINAGKRTLYQKITTAENAQGGLYAAPIQADTKAVGVQTDQVLRKLVEAMGMSWKRYQIVRQIPEGATAEESHVVEVVERMKAGAEEMITVFQGGVNPAPNGDLVDFYMHDGKKQWMQIGDKGLWDSIKFMGPKGTNLALNFMGGFSRGLRRGVTSFPAFQFGNLVRDTASAWMLSGDVKVPAVGALKAVFVRYNSDPSYQEMVLNGGGFANRQQGLHQQAKSVVNPTGWWSRYDRFMSRFENANRLAEYRAARARGAGPREAALLSRDVSTDFAMRGSSETVRALAIMVPFLNARVQGLYRIGRQFTSRDLAISYAFKGALLATATAALYGINKDDERYEEMPEDVKDLNWVFFFGDGADDYFLVPKPFESGMIFGTVVERMLELTERRDGKEFADAMLWIMAEVFNLNMVPQAFQPLLDLKKNKNFAGAPIVPMYLEGVRPGDQWTYYTSRTMREAGDKLNLSPAKMEHMTKGYLGTFGSYLLAVSDATVRATAGPIAAEGEEPTAGETWRENLVVRGFFSKFTPREGPLRRTKYTTDFFDMARQAEEVAKTVSLRMKREADRVEEYISDPDNERLFQGVEGVRAFKKALGQIRVGQDSIRRDPDLSGDEKRVKLWELQMQRNNIAREAVKTLGPMLDQGIQRGLDPTTP